MTEENKVKWLNKLVNNISFIDLIEFVKDIDLNLEKNREKIQLTNYTINFIVEQINK